jgi:hypothetical protein
MRRGKKDDNNHGGIHESHIIGRGCPIGLKQKC